MPGEMACSCSSLPILGLPGTEAMDLLDPREPMSAWTHAAGLMLAIPGTILLLRQSAGDLSKQLSLLIYGLALVFCYADSTLFHAVRPMTNGLGPYARLDGVGIFALIAGTYTPIAWSLLRGRPRVWTLTIVWGVAIPASLVIAIGRRFSPVLGTSLYLGLGWGAVACYHELAKVVSHRALIPIVLGGVSYSLGAVLNLARWPVLVPGVMGAHELFHLFVLAGSAAHYWFILNIVAPFRRPG